MCTKTKAHLYVKPNCTPVYRVKRPVALAAIPEVNQELQRLQQLGIITPVSHLDWIAPIVVKKKANGSIRICGDYSTGLSEVLEPHQYPLLTPDEIFSKLSNNKVFTVIDLSDAFLQVEVDEEFRKLITINTHRGLFQYNRLPFGIKTAPGCFQQIMDMMISGFEGVVAYIDDILVFGKNE